MENKGYIVDQLAGVQLDQSKPNGQPDQENNLESFNDESLKGHQLNQGLRYHQGVLINQGPQYSQGLIQTNQGLQSSQGLIPMNQGLRLNHDEVDQSFVVNQGIKSSQAIHKSGKIKFINQVKSN